MFKTIKIFSPTVSIGDQLNRCWYMNLQSKSPDRKGIPFWSEAYEGKPVLELIPQYNEQKYYAMAIPLKKDWSESNLSSDVNDVFLKFTINITDELSCFNAVSFSSVVDGQKEEALSDQISLSDYVEERDDWVKVSIPLSLFKSDKVPFSMNRVRLFHFSGSGSPIVLLSNIVISS